MDAELRRTISKTSCICLEVKKSKFIAIASPINNNEDATHFVNDVRRRYPDASHHVYAWVSSKPSFMQKYSDDNEPVGTAGQPMMELIRKHKLEDIVVVIARYFGGIKLGTGGLLRAYVQATEQAIISANLIEWMKAYLYRVTVSYSHADSIQHNLKSQALEISSVIYEKNVVMDVCCPIKKTEELKRIIQNLTSGQARIEYITRTEIKNKKNLETANE